MKIDSAAAIKRIPLGTRLYLIRSLKGPQAPSARIVKQVRSADVIVTIDDPTNKNHGRDSYMDLRGVRVEPREDGFALYEKEANEVCAEYRFHEVAP
jgi:hypothetical protein